MVLAVLIALLGPAACGETGRPGMGGRITLSVFWWGGPERARITEKVLSLYTKRHPNVTFKLRWQVNPGYYDKLAELAAGGNAPDLFQLDDNSLSDIAARGITRDLGTFIRDKTIDESRFLDGLAEYGTLNGIQFGVPSATNTMALFYDRTLVRGLGLAEPQLGWDYEQLITWAAGITRKSGGKVYGTMDPSGDYKALWIWLRSQGKELYHGSALGFTADDLTTWFNIWTAARTRGATPPAEIVAAADTSDITKQLVVTKQGATTFGWSNMLSELQQGTDHELGITAFPGNPQSQWARASQYWSIYKRTKHPAVVADVINFMVNNQSAGRILGTERGLPANLDIRARIMPSLSVAMQATVRYENAMAPRYGPTPAAPPKGHRQVRTLLLQAAQSVQWRRATSRQAATEFMGQAQTALGT